MKLAREFYKLPLRFDAARLAAEIAAIPETAWRQHPNHYPGNTALLLVSVHGGENDGVAGPMQMTSHLERCPYLQQVMASFETVIGRARLMRLAPGANVSEHCDINYYWQNHVRVHVPIVTDPAVRFHCNGYHVHMAAGEAWIFDNWRRHSVENPSGVSRVHLVMDTVGTAAFWHLPRKIELSRGRRIRTRFIPYDPQATPRLLFERHNQPRVMPPLELVRALEGLTGELQANRQINIFLCGHFARLLEDLGHEWASAWALHGDGDSGIPVYQRIVAETLRQSARFEQDLPMASNGYTGQAALSAILKAALDPDLQAATRSSSRRPRTARIAAGPVFDRPVFILAAPRSGSTLLFETLARHRSLWTIGDESHRQIEGIRALHPRSHEFRSNRLTAQDATAPVAARLRAAFVAELRDAGGRRWLDLTPDERPGTLRFLEKTPKNALRLPFLRALFPDARFIYLYRNPRDNLSSMLDAWRSGRFVTYPRLPGWQGSPWSLLLVPGWRDLSGKTLPEIIAAQWRETHAQILADLGELPAEQWCGVRHEEVIAQPAEVMHRLCRFLDLRYGERMRVLDADTLQRSRYTLSAPAPDKWRRNAAELEVALPLVADVQASIEDLFAQAPAA